MHGQVPSTPELSILPAFEAQTKQSLDVGPEHSAHDMSQGSQVPPYPEVLLHITHVVVVSISDNLIQNI